MTTEQQPEQATSGSSVTEVATYTVGGGAVGAATSVFAGKVGLAVAGTAVSLGLLPVIGVGAVTGLAVYGLKRAIYS
jgi:hypothetical protein